MPWTPKASSPSSFTILDEFISFIRGEPTWSWLEPWLPYISNYSVDTGDFCAQGPSVAVPALVASDFLPPLSISPGEWLHWQQQLSVKLTRVARDRLFGTFCESVTAAGGGVFGAETCKTYATAGRTAALFAAAVPAGATNIKVRCSNWTGGTGGDRDTRWWQVSTDHELFQRMDANFNGLNVPGTAVVAKLPGCTEVWQFPYGTDDYSATLCYSFDDGGTVDHTPTDQPQPVGLADPVINVYATIADLGQELDRLERKLDWLISDRQFFNTFAPDIPGEPADEPIPVTAPDQVIALVDAIGVMVELSGVPVDSDVGFGTPQQFAHLGRLNFGTATAWYPSVDLTHTPLVIQPLPPQTTRMSATVTPPVSATVTPLLRPK